MRLMGMRLRFRSLGLALLSVAAAGVLLQIGPAQASSKKARPSTASATKPQALAAYGKLPLAFVPNAGQLDRHVRYAAQAGGSSFFFTRTEAVLALRKGKRGVALRLRFLGANPKVGIEASAPAPAGSTTCSGTTPPSGAPTCPPTARRLPRPLARRRPGLPRPERQAQVRVPRPARRTRPADPTRLPRREAALARPARGTSASRPRSAGPLTDSRPVSYQLVGGQARARREPLRARRADGATASPSVEATTAATRSSSTPASSTPPTWAEAVDEVGDGIAVDERRQRLRDRVHRLGGLPDHRGRLRHDPQRRRRRLRDEAGRERRRPRLLHLPGRKWRRRRHTASRSTAPAAPT